MNDFDELRRRTVLAETAYLQAKQAYMYAIEGAADAGVLATAAGRVASAAEASMIADSELHEALKGSSGDEEELLDA